MGKEIIIYDAYNGCVKADQTAINTLTTKCGAYGMREGVKIIIYDRTKTSGTNRRNARTSRQSVWSGRTLSYIDNNGGGGNLQPKIMEMEQETKLGAVEPFVRGSLQEHASERSDGICPTLTEAMGKGGGQVPVHNYNVRIRKLTPRECWRLMGFSDEDFDRAKAVNSDSQLYKQAGNSICVPVLEEIFRGLL